MNGMAMSGSSVYPRRSGHLAIQTLFLAFVYTTKRVKNSKNKNNNENTVCSIQL